MKKLFLLLSLLLLLTGANAQIKILFDATKAETAGNADWVIDADQHNLDWNPGPVTGTGNESNPQRIPTPAQSAVTSNTPETYWEGAISAWGIDLVKSGYTVETLPPTGSITYGNSSNAQDLTNYKVFIIDEPNIRFTTAEKAALMQFVQNGGGLFMISDHAVSDRNGDNWDSQMIWNDFVNAYNNPFGITWDSLNFSQTTTNIPNLPGDSLLHGPYGNVTEMQYSGGTSMTIYPAKNSSVKGVVYKTGSSFGNNNVLMAYARYGNGKVAAMGDSSPTDDGTGDPNDVLYNGWTTDAAGNHEKLIMNATIWLAATSVPTANPFGLTTTSDTTICSGAAVTLTAHGATTYLWQPGGATTASITVTPTSTGMYIVTGNNSYGTKSDTVKITVDQFPTSLPQITANGPLTFCAGKNVILTAPLNTSYKWSNGNTSRSITVTQQGAYTVTVTNSNQCKAVSNTASVAVDTFSTTHPAIIAGGPLSFCTGNHVVLNAPNGYTYNWSNGSTLSAITVSQTGAYYVTVTNNNNCSALSDTAHVSVSASLSGVALSPLSTYICSGTSATISAPAGYNSYVWNTGATTQAISVTQPGNYFVSVSAGNNCSGISDTAVVNIDTFNLSPAVISAGSNTTFCQGGSVLLSALNAGNYLWSNNSTQQQITVVSTGIYSLTITDAHNCRATSNSITVNVLPLPSVTLQLSPDSICTNSILLLTGGNPAGGTYSGIGVSGVQLNAGQAGIGTDTVYYTYTDGNGCSNKVGQPVAIVLCNGIEVTEEFTCSVYPNPSYNKFVFEPGSGSGTVSIKIYNANGQLVSTHIQEHYTADRPIIIDLSTAPAGIYLTEIGRNNHILRKKLIKLI